VARVDGSRLVLADGPTSVYDLAWQACTEGTSLRETMDRSTGSRTLDYDEIYNGRSPWRLLPPIDNPDTPARC